MSSSPEVFVLERRQYVTTVLFKKECIIFPSSLLVLSLLVGIARPLSFILASIKISDELSAPLKIGDYVISPHAY